MKVISFALMLGFSLCASLCCNEPDDYYYNRPYYSVNADNFISIQNDVTSLGLGETIFVESTIQNEQVTYTGEVINISHFLDEQNPLYFDLVLYKLNIYGNLDIVALNTASITQVEGQTRVFVNGNDAVISVTLERNTQNGEDSLKNTFGITILESGTYYLGANYYMNNGGRISFYTQNSNGGVNFSTSIVNSNNEGLYEFTVN